ncbi:MAG: hypothetical protein U0325_16665 [Polyangiales bacterium]
MSSRLLLLAVALLHACAAGSFDPPVDAARDVSAPRDAVVAADVPTANDVESADVVVSDSAAPPADGGCRPNNDGVITRAEFPGVVGASALYLVNRDGVTVDGVNTAGTVTEGTRRWDFSARRMDDQPVLDEVLSPQGRWWSGQYADASFASVIDRATNLLGVYRLSATALELLGTVSTTANQTNLRFSPPVQILRFPLRVGDRWQQTVNGNGTVNFTPLVNVTNYTTSVDAQGEVWTPAARFPALRVNTTLDQSIPLTVFRRTLRTYAFITECGGLVARVASVENDTAENFTRASEYRRLNL